MFFNAKSSSTMEGTLKNENELLEQYIYDEVSMLDDEGKKAFIESAECKVLQEKGLISRKTLVRLSKNDDLTRRTKMATFQLAKERKDPLWAQLVKVRIKERMLINKIFQKYQSKGGIVAKKGQRDHLKQIMGGKFVRPSIDANDRADGR